MQRLVLVSNVGKQIRGVQVRLVLVGNSFDNLVEASFVKSKAVLMFIESPFD